MLDLEWRRPVLTIGAAKVLLFYPIRYCELELKPIISGEMNRGVPFLVSILMHAWRPWNGVPALAHSLAPVACQRGLARRISAPSLKYLEPSEGGRSVGIGHVKRS
jgi:hypothetical protein